ncbi:MAG: DsrE/DsrF/DrsH-like family protein [Candidatus Brocadiales bacterium]
MDKNGKKLAIFAHSGTYDKLYQTVTIAVTAASMGRDVYMFLFFWALKRFVEEGGLETMDFPPEYGEEGPALGQRMKALNPTSLQDMLDEVKKTGKIKVYACSASVKYMGLDDKKVMGKVDEVVGLPVILQMAEDSDVQLFI